MKIPFHYFLKTSGIGYWSNESRWVTVTFIDVPYIDEDEDFGELRVFFDTETWNVEEHGLIYTDTGFIKELKRALMEHGFDPTDVSYSEQGMQGDNYVSLDVGPAFLESWIEDGVTL